jgi:hypothetical protein
MFGLSKKEKARKALEICFLELSGLARLPANLAKSDEDLVVFLTCDVLRKALDGAGKSFSRLNVESKGLCAGFAFILSVPLFNMLGVKNPRAWRNLLSLIMQEVSLAGSLGARSFSDYAKVAETEELIFDKAGRFAYTAASEQELSGFYHALTAVSASLYQSRFPAVSLFAINAFLEEFMLPSLVVVS